MSFFQFDDGGREAAGFKGTTGDCCARAFAIASGRPYREIYNLINKIGRENAKRAGRRGSGTSAARSGVYVDDAHKLAQALGFKWVPTMQIGSGCHVHLTPEELPQGRIVCNVSKHFAAVINGVLRDTYDCSRGGTRCVYGYWVAPEEKTSKQKLLEFVAALNDEQADALRAFLLTAAGKGDK